MRVVLVGALGFLRLLQRGMASPILTRSDGDGSGVPAGRISPFRSPQTLQLFFDHLNFCVGVWLCRLYELPGLARGLTVIHID